MQPFSEGPKSDPPEGRWDRHVFEKTQEQKRRAASARAGAGQEPRWVRRERERREREKQKAALRDRARAVPEDSDCRVGRNEDPRFQVFGFFLEPKDPEHRSEYVPEVFLKTQIPEMVERASELPGTTLVQADLCDPDTGERSVRTICQITGNYTHRSDQQTDEPNL